MSTSLHPSLPPKPTLPPHPKTHHENTPDAQEPEPSSSSVPPTTFCTICTRQLAKYTCPGCSIRTCSVACSSSHKSKTSCRGVRDKAKYVPMKEYTWGKMMDDYTFLEDMGRKVGDWGKEIVRGGYMASAPNARGRGDTRRRGMRGGRGGGGGGPVKTRRDVLKMQLEARDIEMELLAAGMEKRKINQSVWDNKKQTAMLTIEFKFYKPKDPLAPSSTPRAPPFILTTHKNDIKSPLLDLIRSHLPERANSRKESGFPEWVKRLVFPDADDPNSFTNPQCVMAAQLDPQMTARHRAGPKNAYHTLDPTQKLAAVLRHTHFVEFPTIEIWDEFLGPIVDAQGYIRSQLEDRPVKRRKMNSKAGKLAITGLLGGYGSEDEEEDEDKPQNMLAALGDYIDSGEDEQATKVDGDDLEDVDLGELSENDAEGELDPAALLELMKGLQGGEPWAVEEEDAVDWGDLDNEGLE